jgi:hypothetical protein
MLPSSELVESSSAASSAAVSSELAVVEESSPVVESVESVEELPEESVAEPLPSELDPLEVSPCESSLPPELEPDVSSPDVEPDMDPPDVSPMAVVSPVWLVADDVSESSDPPQATARDRQEMAAQSERFNMVASRRVAFRRF